MVATFVVEDGTGLTTANAYITVAEADQYHENYGNPTTWSGTTEASKQEAIRAATQFLDGLYGPRWKGRKTEYDQALDWPRFNAFRETYLLDSDEIPVEVKNATAVMALRYLGLASETLLVPDLDQAAPIIQETVRAGPVNRTLKYASGKVAIKKYSEVDRMVRPLINPRGQLRRS